MSSFRARGAALVVAVALAGCRPAESPLGIEFPELAGVWHYRAWEVKTRGVECTIEGISLTLRQPPLAGDLTGEASAGEMKCVGADTSYTVPTQAYPIPVGYTFNEFVGFNIYNAQWAHQGFVVTRDSLNGTFELVNGPNEFSGLFTAVRERR